MEPRAAAAAGGLPTSGAAASQLAMRQRSAGAGGACGVGPTPDAEPSPRRGAGRMNTEHASCTEPRRARPEALRRSPGARTERSTTGRRRKAGGWVRSGFAADQPTLWPAKCQGRAGGRVGTTRATGRALARAGLSGTYLSAHAAACQPAPPLATCWTRWSFLSRDGEGCGAGGQRERGPAKRCAGAGAAGALRQRLGGGESPALSKRWAVRCGNHRRIRSGRCDSGQPWRSRSEARCRVPGARRAGRRQANAGREPAFLLQGAGPLGAGQLSRQTSPKERPEPDVEHP